MKLDEAHAGLVLADIWVTSCYMNITDKNTHTYTYVYYIYILDIRWLQISFQGRFIFCRFDHFKIKNTISRKQIPLHVLMFKSCWVCPGISALFPGISAQNNRHIFTQSRVRSAQKVRKPKLTTVVKKWPFPAPSQEIRPKGRNLANGELFVSFRRSI